MLVAAPHLCPVLPERTARWSSPGSKTPGCSEGSWKYSPHSCGKKSGEGTFTNPIPVALNRLVNIYFFADFFPLVSSMF